MENEINECCKQPENLEVKDSGKPDLVLRVCKICHHRHFELTVDAGQIGVIGGKM